jgi:hypothetical protein
MSITHKFYVIHNLIVQLLLPIPPLHLTVVIRLKSPAGNFFFTYYTESF